MGRKLVRKNELLRSGGLLSFPRTGCALRASVILSREKRSRHHGRTVLSRQPNVQRAPWGHQLPRNYSPFLNTTFPPAMVINTLVFPISSGFTEKIS